jgi:hypothetical protein
MKDRPDAYIFDWLAYHRASRKLVFSACATILLGSWHATHALWRFCMRLGQEEPQSMLRIRELVAESNPVLHIAIIYMTDSELICNKVDASIWLVIFFTFTVLRVYLAEATRSVKTHLGQLE